MDKMQLTKTSNSLDLILRKIADVKFQCITHQDSAKQLHSGLQTLLNTHEKYPEIFNSNEEIRALIEISIKSFNKLSIDIDNNYSIQIHDMEFILRGIRDQVFESLDLPEFYSSKINIDSQLNTAQYELSQVINIRAQLKSYIDYHVRALKSINMRPS
jgi:plasmid maintenance system killer protein